MIKFFSGFVFFGLFFISHFSALGQGASVELEGKWVDKKMQVSYEFKADSSCWFEQAGYPVFIKSYTADVSQDPVWLEFTMSQGAMTINIPAILKVVDENTIWIEQLIPGAEYRSEFSTQDENGNNSVHVLKRE